MYACMHVNMYVCMCVYLCVCGRMCMLTYVYIYMHNICVYANIFRHIYTCIYI